METQVLANDGENRVRPFEGPLPKLEDVAKRTLPQPEDKLEDGNAPLAPGLETNGNEDGLANVTPR